MKRLISPLLFCLLATFVQPVIGQESDPEIYVYELKEKKGKVTLTKGKNVTNRKGYDNQPHFYKEDLLLYASSIEGQTDIMLYDMYNDETHNLTNSEVSEYSPTMVPGYDSYSVIRQDLEGNQLLYLYHIDRKKKPELLIDGISPVGYHAWNGTNVAMFVLGEPITMVLTDSKDRSNDRIITSNIGRTLKTIPDSNKIAFERTEEDKSVVIYALDPSTDEFEKVITKPENAGDWAITKNGTYITSVASKLLKFNPKHDESWVEIMDLGNTGTGVISRMAVSPDNGRIAIVINH
jgi:Tol biopolymer transport system component